MKKLLIFILPFFLMVGCAQNAWYKPTAKQGDFEKDRYDCLQQSQQQYSAAQTNGWQGAAVSKTITNDGLFSSCMNAKGWSLQNQQAAQQAIQQQAAANQNTKSQYATLMNQQSDKLKAIESDPEYSIILQRTAVTNTKITFQQLADNTRITSAQKPVFLKFRAAMDKQRNENISIHRSYGGQNGVTIANNAIKFGQLTEKAALELYGGKITWGEYNQKLKDASAELAKKQ